jgi:hypothetical protein
MVATYRSNKALYDEIQKRTPGSKASEQQLGATVFLISGCQDDQLSKDGFTNGAFTEQLLKVWDDGAWQGGYRAFHEAILSRMPKDDEQPQEPNFNPIGPENPTFEQQDPFTV